MEWLTIFLINWFINILAMEFLVCRKIKNVLKKDEERDSRFPAFRRHDIQWLNRPWLFMTCQFMLAKIFYGFFILLLLAITSSICARGLGDNEPMTGWKYKLNRFVSWFAGWQTNFSGGGGFWAFNERPIVSYKKFLGDDWVADYDTTRCGSIITNHSSLLDISLGALRQLPCFVAKAGVRDIPILGWIAVSGKCLFVDRQSGKDKKSV